VNTQHILVPIDFGDCTHGLVEQASGLAKSLGARLTLLHVTDPPEGLGGLEFEADGGTQSSQELLDQEAHDRLRGYAALAEQAGVSVATRVVHGEPSEHILLGARQLSADMLVMGTHGRRGLARLVLGSVAETVLRESPIPVVTVRTKHRPECEASSCATCSTHVTPAMKRVQAEMDG
jgi:nucleotide-binding universal stress UspA family protein